MRKRFQKAIKQAAQEEEALAKAKAQAARPSIRYPIEDGALMALGESGPPPTKGSEAQTSWGNPNPNPNPNPLEGSEIHLGAGLEAVSAAFPGVLMLHRHA